ncbi:MAG: glycosyl transferase family 28, partial [Rhizobiales bacterium]|nr:glycosyl transferase family 28 [Hyphomicrobiales bacterium]
MSGSAALIAVTHLMGVGHFVRAVAIGRALVAAGWRVVIASGGAPVETVDAAGCEIVQLPPLHCVDADFRRLLRPDGSLADDDYLARRRRALLEAFDRCAPDVLITELFPFGRRRLAPEFEALLAHARGAAKRPAILCSVRDVLHPPSNAEKIRDAAARFARFYDAVLFHGDEALVPLTASWPADASLLRHVRATGYIRDAARSGDDHGARDDGKGEIVVSGGGSAAGSALARVAIEAARLTPERRWRILVGRGVADHDYYALRAAAPANALVEWARVDFPALLQRAALSVSQAGYNTVLDLAAARARAILVPFAGGEENEQSTRADCLARRGLARVIEEKTLAPAALAEEAERAL